MIEDFGGCEGDCDFGISGRVISVIKDVSDVWIVGYECFEDVVVIVEIECNSVSQCFSPYLIIPVYIVFKIMYIGKLKKMRPKPHFLIVHDRLDIGQQPSQGTLEV